MLFGKHLNKYYLRYAALFIGGIIALILVDVAQLHIPRFLSSVTESFEAAFDPLGSGWTDELIDNVTRCALYTLGVALVMLFGRIVFRFCLFSASHRIEANIRHEMFLKAERLPTSYYHENPVGNAMSWFTNDLETITDFLGWGTVMLVDAVIMSSMALVCLFRCDWQLSIVVILPILLIVVWGLLVENRMDKLWGMRQKAYDELYDYSQESFTGIRVIKAFVKENQQVLSFGKIARKNKDVNIKFVRTDTIFNVIIETIIHSITALLLGFGGWFIYSVVTGNPIVVFGSETTLTLPKLVEFTGYFDTLIWPMIALGQVVAMFSRARASLRRISNFLDSDEQIIISENPVKLENCSGKIEFKNFSFSYPGNKNPSIDSVSLTIQPGETIGVVGKIGCGKTTLVNSLLRLYNIEKNSILIDDIDLMELDIQSLRKNIAYVPQDNFLYSDKVKNNISFGNNYATQEEIEHAADFACVHRDISEFVDGYDTISGERGVTLSGGQKQRISIARAFVKNAPIMILDDSVSAVDVKTEERILSNIKEERKGKTTILIASRISTVSHLDKIIVLKNGKLEAFGSHAELLKCSPTYQSMHLLQELEAEKGGDE